MHDLTSLQHVCVVSMDVVQLSPVAFWCVQRRWKDLIMVHWVKNDSDNTITRIMESCVVVEQLHDKDWGHPAETHYTQVSPFSIIEGGSELRVSTISQIAPYSLVHYFLQALNLGVGQSDRQVDRWWWIYDLLFLWRGCSDHWFK